MELGETDTVQNEGNEETAPCSLSIVMRCGKHSVWADEALHSILNQDFSSLEVLAVTTPETDETGEIARQWSARDPRVRVVTCASTDAAAAFTSGASHAKGTYLLCIHADELLTQHGITNVLRILDESGDDYAVADAQYFSATESHREIAVKGLHETETGRRWHARGALWNTRHTGVRILRRNLLEREPSLATLSFDATWLTKLLLAADGISLVPEILLHRRRNELPAVAGFDAENLNNLLAYFKQEAECADSIGGTTSVKVSKEYWKSISTAQGWKNFVTGLAIIGLNGDSAQQSRFSGSIRRITRQIPDYVYEQTPAENSVSLAYASIGELQGAQEVITVATQLKQGEIAPLTAAKLIMTVIDTCPIPTEIHRQVRGLYGKFVLTPLLESGTNWPREDLRSVCASSIQLNSQTDLLELVKPNTRASRVLRAVLTGNDATTWKELARAGERGPLQGKIVENRRGRDLLSAARVDPAETIDELVWLPVGSPISAEGTEEKRCTPRTCRDGIRVPLELSPGEWMAIANCHDDFGAYQRQVLFETSAAESRRSSYRCMGDSLHVLPSGSERIRKALAWRIAAVNRRISRDA